MTMKNVFPRKSQMKLLKKSRRGRRRAQKLPSRLLHSRQRLGHRPGKLHPVRPRAVQHSAGERRVLGVPGGQAERGAQLDVVRRMSGGRLLRNSRRCKRAADL